MNISIVITLVLAGAYLLTLISFVFLDIDRMWNGIVDKIYWTLIGIWWIICGVFIDSNRILVVAGLALLGLVIIELLIECISYKKDFEKIKKNL